MEARKDSPQIINSMDSFCNIGRHKFLTVMVAVSTPLKQIGKINSSKMQVRTDKNTFISDLREIERHLVFHKFEDEYPNIGYR